MPLLAPDRPDWRWARVAELSQYSDTQAAARLEHEDAQTRSAFRFKRALDRGLAGEYPVTRAAYDCFVNRPQHKWALDGLLLAGATDEQVAVAIFADPSIVKTYHDLFFWVRPGLQHPAWISSTLFGGMPHRSAHAHDHYGLALRLAWLGGVDTFLQVIDRQPATSQMTKLLRELASSTLLKNSVETAFTIGSRGDQAAEIMRFSIENGARDDVAVNVEDDVHKALNTFMSTMSLSVADPSDERNLRLPAREDCAVAYEVVNDA